MTAQWHGAYLATVHGNVDPRGQNRVQLKIPQVLGTAVSQWATPFAVVQPAAVPAVGSSVVAMFLGGDPSHPVYANKTQTASLFASYDATVTEDNPVAWWKLNDATGSTLVLDSSGNGNNGTPTSVTFQQPQAVDSNPSTGFNGTTSNIVTAYTPAALSAITVEAWVNLNGLTASATDPVIVSNSNTTSTNKGFQLKVHTATQIPALQLGNGTAWTSFSVGAALPATGWVHLVATWDGSTVTCYQNGVTVSTASWTGPLAADTAVTIGASTGGGSFFEGLMSEVVVYPTALSMSRVLAHYNAKTGAVTSQNIAGNTITADQIAAGAITAKSIAAGTIIAGVVDGTTINAATFNGSTFEGNDFVINPLGAFFYSGTPSTANHLTGDNATFGSSTGNWTAAGNCSISWVSTPVSKLGGGALKMTCTTAGTIGAASCLASSITTNGLACSAGDKIVAAAWVRAASTGETVLLQVSFYNSSGTALSTATVATSGDVTGSYTQISGNATAPSSAAYCRLYVQITGCALNEVHYIGSTAYIGDATTDPGNLIASVSQNSGMDLNGNQYLQGHCSYNSSGTVAAQLHLANLTFFTSSGGGGSWASANNQVKNNGLGLQLLASSTIDLNGVLEVGLVNVGVPSATASFGLSSPSGAASQIEVQGAIGLVGRAQPASPPSGMGYLYVNSSTHALHYKGPSGTDTLIAAG